MANELTLYAEPGQTLTATLMRGLVRQAQGIAIVESTQQAGFYVGDVPGSTPAGSYAVLFLAGSAVRAVGQLLWDGAAEVQGGSSSDPLAAEVPGTYADGTAGAALGKLNTAAPLGPAVVVPGIPAELGLCRVYAYLETVDNLPAANVEIEFILMSPGTTASERLIAGRTVTARTDAQGRLTGNGSDPFVELQRNDLLTPSGTTYLVRCPELGVAGKTVTLADGVADLRALLLAP